MKNMDLVINEKRGVDQFSHPRPAADDIPHARKSAEQIDVIEQRIAKTRSGIAA